MKHKIKFSYLSLPCDSMSRESPEKATIDASESHKTLSNLSARVYFRQFSDW